MIPWRDILKYLLGAAGGATIACYALGPRMDRYRLWFNTLRWIIEDHYGDRVEVNSKNWDCGVAFEEPDDEKNPG